MPQYSPGFLPIDAWPLPMLCRPSTTVHSVLFGTDAKGPCGRPPQRLDPCASACFRLVFATRRARPRRAVEVDMPSRADEGDTLATGHHSQRSAPDGKRVHTDAGLRQVTVIPAAEGCDGRTARGSRA